MVRRALSRRTEPGTTLAPTLNPTFSTNVGSAAVLAASSAGVRKYTPVSFTPSAIRNPTLPTMRAAPRRNLWPAFIAGSGDRGTRLRAQSSLVQPTDSSPGRSLGACPREGGAHGALPAVRQQPALRGGGGRLEPAEVPPAEKLRAAPPHSQCDAGQAGGAERGGLDHVRPLDRNTQHVGLELHQPVVGGGPAVRAEHRHLEPSRPRTRRRARHRREQLRAAERHRLQRGARQVRAGGSAGQASDRPARLRVPVWRAQTDERGDEVYAAGVGNAAGERVGFAGRADEAEAVAKPLHRRARDEYAALERICRLAAGSARGR